MTIELRIGYSHCRRCQRMSCSCRTSPCWTFKRRWQANMKASSVHQNPICLFLRNYPVDNVNAARADSTVYSCEYKLSPASISYFTIFIQKEQKSEQTLCFNVDGASCSCADRALIASQPSAGAGSQGPTRTDDTHQPAHNCHNPYHCNVGLESFHR